MDIDELLVSVAQSFIDKDLGNCPIYITKQSDKYASIVFCVENNNTFLNDKEMISQTDIEVNIDLEDEAILVETNTQNGWVITDEEGFKTTHLTEDKETNCYTVYSDTTGKHIQCESHTSTTYTYSVDTKEGSRSHSNYEQKKLGKNKIDVVDEYSILDGYPVSKALKSFTKVIYNVKK